MDGGEVGTNVTRSSPRHAGPVRRHAGQGRRRASAPVFVDVTGRRRRIVRHIVVIAGLLVTAYLSVVGVGLLAGADAPLTPWPGRAPHSPDAGAGLTGPSSGATRDTSPPSPAASSPRAGATRPAAVSSGAATAAAQPTAVSHPGNSHATPHANGRTRTPGPKRT
jgi:hypothetical protein